MNSDPPAADVAHRWRPIEDLPDDWKRLADRDLLHLAEFWNENRREMAAHGAVKAFNEWLGREWAIETGLIERIYTLDPRWTGWWRCTRVTRSWACSLRSKRHGCIIGLPRSIGLLAWQESCSTQRVGPHDDSAA